MSTPVQIQPPIPDHGPLELLPARAHGLKHIRLHLPTLPEAGASLLRTVIVALFLLTFVLQPFLIPSESMEHTLLVGDFLLVNKQIVAPAGNPGSVSRRVLPFREIQRGDTCCDQTGQCERRRSQRCQSGQCERCLARREGSRSGVRSPEAGGCGTCRGGGV